MRRPSPSTTVKLPDGLNPTTVRLVHEFATAMAAKLKASQEKYGYVDGWARSDWEGECRQHLSTHLKKGDPLDVAIYAAFMWRHGWSTKETSDVRQENDDLRAALCSLLSTTVEERNDPAVWFPRVDAARQLLKNVGTNYVS